MVIPLQTIDLEADPRFYHFVQILTIGLGVCLVMGTNLRSSFSRECISKPISAGVHYKAFGYPTPLPPAGGNPLSYASNAAVWTGKVRGSSDCLNKGCVARAV